MIIRNLINQRSFNNRRRYVLTKDLPHQINIPTVGIIFNKTIHSKIMDKVCPCHITINAFTVQQLRFIKNRNSYLAIHQRAPPWTINCARRMHCYCKMTYNKVQIFLEVTYNKIQRYYLTHFCVFVTRHLLLYLKNLSLTFYLFFLSEHLSKLRILMEGKKFYAILSTKRKKQEEIICNIFFCVH